MRLKVIKYFILSRFTRPFVFGTLAFLVMMVLIYSSLSKSIFEPKIISGLKVSFAEFVTLFVIFSGFSSTVQKADYDFLLPSPLRRSEISLLYLIASMLLGGGYFIMLGSIFLFIYPPLLGVLSLLSFSLFGIAVSSLSLLREKIYIIIFTAIWVWLPFFNIYFSPSAMLFGSPYLGALSSFVYSVPILYRALTDPELQITSVRGEKVKSIIRNTGKNFLTKYFLITYEFAWGFGSSLSGRRLFYYVLSFPKMMVISTVGSVVYFFIYFLFLKPYTFYSIMAPSIVILAFFMSMGIYSISQERLWLVFISLDRGWYLSKKVRIKTWQNALLTLPFAVADSLLSEVALGISLFFGVIIGYSLTSVLSSKLNPIQFRGEAYNYRAGVGMLLVILTEYTAMGISVASALSLLSSLFFATVSFITFIIVTRKKVWENISYEIVDKGFV